MVHRARRTIEPTALVALATILLAACNASGSVPAVLPGATVSAQLRESDGGPWVVGAASVSLRSTRDLRARSGRPSPRRPAPPAAPSRSACRAKALRCSRSPPTLPATEPAAVYPTALGLACDRANLTVSDASARVALGFDHFFETNEGGGRARALRSEGGVAFIDMLAFSTKNATVSGTLTCGYGALPLSYTLSAGWNLVTARVSGGDSTLVTSPLSTPLVLRRASSVVVQ